MNEAHERVLQAMRHGVRDARHVATCLRIRAALPALDRAGLQGRAEHRRLPADHVRRRGRLRVPGQKYTFGVVKAAQARGDFQVLVERDRRALRVHLGTDVAAGLATLNRILSSASKAMTGQSRK